MKVYKFGGASVRSKEGVDNMLDIVKREQGPLFIVVSAMGKTTNAMERVHEAFMVNDTDTALSAFAQVENYHRDIVEGLFGSRDSGLLQFEELCRQIKEILTGSKLRDDFDKWYDRIVSYGELLSTSIVSEYLNYKGVNNLWIDIRQCFITDSRFREANINIESSTLKLKNKVAEAACSVFVSQGFIGATTGGEPTTLGREGSDYSAAMAGYILDAQSVTIWKDVDGVLNADPRIFKDTVHISELTYLDAIELAYSGAQIIHPKTIKPLQNKSIPLYVKPFSDCTKLGTVITETISAPIDVPIYILKKSQVLISVRPKDFSFVIEERLADIFSVFGEYRQKINLIQSSAVNLSVCVDDSRLLERVVDTLQVDFRVVYNKNMELLTIRGYDEQAYQRYAETQGVYLVQKTRRAARVVRYAVKE